MPITLLTASFLAIVFVYLSVAVTFARRSTGVSLGTGANDVPLGSGPAGSPLLVAMRTHANFAEYVPISLILTGLLEREGFQPNIIFGLSGALVLARLMHPIGMTMKAPNFFRAGGILLQWLMLFAAGILGLVCILGPMMRP